MTMVAKRPKIVIIGAGMAGITAAHKLYTTPGIKDSIELCVVEGGQRIGGRINTREFGGDRIEMGATWIHGIGGSPIYEIVQKIGSLGSEQSWECMDGLHEDRLALAETRAEGGFLVGSSIVEPISSLFDDLMSFSKEEIENGDVGEVKNSSIGSFLKHGFEKYMGSMGKSSDDVKVCENWSRKSLEEAIFAVFENTQRTYTGACDLFHLDYAAESEYILFPGDEITIPRGYISVIESLASVLPPGLIQLGKKVVKIEWQPNGFQFLGSSENVDSRPVKLHFSDGSVMQADHVIVTVSLGVLKAGISEEAAGLFSPCLPSLKKEAISKLGYGVVNKLFLELNPQNKNIQEGHLCKFPFLHLAFHRSDSEFKHKKIPWWMRRTASIYPIHDNSTVLLSWFAGKEALELESLEDEAIIDGVSKTLSSFISNSDHSHEECNGYLDLRKPEFDFNKVLKSKWGTDPLFLGSYSYVQVGSSGEDFDTLAQPLPASAEHCSSTNFQPLQILFAGEATHRTHYSTTHGAYFSGLREANRLLQHYNMFVG